VFEAANMTCVCLYLGVHKHPMKVGEDQEIKERTRKLIEEQVERTPKATNFVIVMEASKELVDELLIDLKGVPVKKYDLEELVPVLEKCKYMSSLSIKNDVTAFRYIQRFRIMDGIAMLRGYSH
jgi:seryl-tRNA synthetase